MRKASVINGLALALVLSATSVATAQGQNRAERQRGVQADSGFRRGPGGRGGEGLLLRGIALSAEQKTRIAAIGEREREAMKASRSKLEKGDKGQKGQRGERGAQGRQRADSAAFAARRAEMEKRREQHVTELRSVLTGEQRVQFDKNVAELKQRVAQRGMGGKGKRA